MMNDTGQDIVRNDSNEYGSKLLPFLYLSSLLRLRLCLLLFPFSICVFVIFVCCFLYDILNPWVFCTHIHINIRDILSVGGDLELDIHIPLL